MDLHKHHCSAVLHNGTIGTAVCIASALSEKCNESSPAETKAEIYLVDLNKASW